MGTPHKHAAVIKAWADGADIQYRRPDLIDWSDAPQPTWRMDYEYRVKPVPHKWQKEIDAYKNGKIIQVRCDSFNWGEFSKTSPGEPAWVTSAGWEYRIKPEPVEQLFFFDAYFMRRCSEKDSPNLKLTFEDGRLIKAEVLHD